MTGGIVIRGGEREGNGEGGGGIVIERGIAWVYIKK